MHNRLNTYGVTRQCPLFPLFATSTVINDATVVTGSDTLCACLTAKLCFASYNDHPLIKLDDSMY